MHKAETQLEVVARRLAEARAESGLSQRRLGIVAGMDETVASPRINQYERAKVQPSLPILEILGKVLDRPLPWFFCRDDKMAEWLLLYHRAKPGERRTLLKRARE